MKKVLVTGGAGYIGSHMLIKLLEANYQPIVIDNLSTGSVSAIPKNVPLHIFNIGDKSKLAQVLTLEKIDAVMHFAADIDVGESITNPAKYYQNNVTNTLNMAETMVKFDIKKLVFSSTAAIYGETLQSQIDETHPKNPLNPYGHSKLICEQIFQDFEKAYGLQTISLRYFNAAGADSTGRAQTQNAERKNLIPSILQVAQGKRTHIEVFGRDYSTHDGTCIRDYVHVMDLCDAHLLALKHLLRNKKSYQYNLGNGRGYSVQEVIDATKKVTKKNIRILNGPRRPGDPSIIIANAASARQELGWKPIYYNIETMIEHAWQWSSLQK